jgi:hypothetical protein
MTTLSPFRDEVEEWLPPLPAIAQFFGPGTGKWVVLVAGFDHERSGVDFEQLALNRMALLIERHRLAQARAKASALMAMQTAPRFVLFDVKSGIVRRSEVWKPKGERKWTEIARFNPVSAANYSGGGHVFDTDPAGVLSITDVYRHVQQIGRTEPGSLAELSVLSHGWVGGPILVNSFDRTAPGTLERDPDDRDARADKDFEPPNMDAAAKADFQKAFATDAFVWTWGCVFANSPRQVLHRVVNARKYRRAGSRTLPDTETFKLSFSQEHADTFFDVDPAFFPARGADGKFPLTFTRTLADIKTFLSGRLGATYCQSIAIAAQVPCFGALSGTYADYEKGRRSNKVMLIPTKKPPYADDFAGYIRFYTKYLKRELDPEGRHYGRYDP